jgi:predicted permease
MDRLLLDLRLALRRLRANPGFTIVAVLTLALGIGANTAVFSVINAVVLRPLPVARSAELAAVNETLAGTVIPLLSYPNYRDFRDRNTALSGLIAYQIVPASLGIPGNSQRVWGYLVTGNYFDVLGVSAARGRLFTPDDDRRPGAHPVAVLSYACWQQRFGGDPAIVGRVVKFNGREFTVLGVAPQGFLGTELFFAPEVFFPMMMQHQIQGGSGFLDSRDSNDFFVVGRRKRGVTLPQAQAALNTIAHRLAEEYPKEDGGMKIVLTPPGLAGDYLRGPVVGFAAALFAVSCLVLLVACTNLASLLLARAADQRKQTAIRLALGAARGRLVRQLLTESLVVALAGAAAGALVALWITDSLRAWKPPITFPLLLDAPLDLRVFLFTLLVSGGTALLFGLVPALQATKADLLSALKGGAIGDKLRHWHLRDYLVAAQVALSVLLMVCSVLVVKSLQRALQAPIGYNPHGAVSSSFDLNLHGYDEARGREFQRRLLEKLRALPGIESAALIDQLPLSLATNANEIYVEGQPKRKPTETPFAYTFSVSTDYFRTMQTRLLMGREFDSREKPGGKPVAIVNQAFVKQLLRSDRPLGMRFQVGPDGNPIEIVGVAENGKYFSLNEPEKPAYWVPLEIEYSPTACVVARSRVNSSEALRLIRGAVSGLDPAIALYSVKTLSSRLDLPLFPARVAASVLGAFGLLAAILAATGIYGVMAYAVARRTREIGIRMAVGAGQGQILSIVGRHALVLIGAGTALGLAAALAAGRFLGQILYGVQPTDPLTFATVLLLTLAIASLACWIPARRAIRIDPIAALRQE